MNTILGNPLVTEVGKACLKRTGEEGSGKALDTILKWIKEKYGKSTIDTGAAFEKYFENSEIRYNQIKTLADKTEPRSLHGKDGIYVDVYVEYKQDKILAKSVSDLSSISNNIAIVGSGGIGKSVLLRHLFIDSINKGDYIPVLIELRKICVDEQKTMIELIHSSIEAFDVNLSEVQLEYSLQTGKYLFLFDGLDEVKEKDRQIISKMIQELTNRYPKNFYILSTRKGGVRLNELETYTFVEVSRLVKYQAIELIEKLGRKSEKSVKFTELLSEKLFEEHRDFAENALLLTMMYITFEDINMIPEHIVDFYEHAYNALYKKHDGNKEGVFQRDFKCKIISDRQFKDLFAYFCFGTFFSQKYEFTEEEILTYIDKGIQKLCLGDVLHTAKDFFNDVKNIVCLIVEEGTVYKFAHRSFQTYFAAYYVTIHVSDEQQKKLFKQKLEEEWYYENNDFYDMLYSLERERFNENILFPGISGIVHELDASPEVEYRLLQLFCQQVVVLDNRVVRGVNSIQNLQIPYTRNILSLFSDTICLKCKSEKNEELISNLIQAFEIGKDDTFAGRLEIEVSDFQKIQDLSMRRRTLELVYSYFSINELLEEIRKWYKEQQERRNKMKKSDILLELL